MRRIFPCEVSVAGVLRSALYMPASNTRALEKARDLPTDAVVIDLEDAVAPDAKAQGRKNAAEAALNGGFGRRAVVVRVNGADTPWGAEDLRAVAAAKPDVILAPKVSAPADIALVRSALGPQSDGIALWAMIETARALLDLPALASSSADHGVDTWVVGTNDLSKELRCRLEGDRAPLWGHLGAIVAAARAYGLTALDGVYNSIEDDEGLAAECRQGVGFGFDGKTLIHPRQLEACNRIFSPSDVEVAWAKTVVDAFALPENARAGVLRVEGRMVERLHLTQAERLLALSSAA